METQITARHFDASPTLRERAHSGLSKLERFYDGITNAHVILREGDQPDASKEVEITLSVYRKRLCAQQANSSYEQAINDCVESLRRQLIKYKDKLKSKDKDSYR